MITLQEIYQIIEKSLNPIIFFDDDPDGLASFLLIKKHFKKGKGIAIKSSPKLDELYLRKIKELNPDLVIVLDKPIITQEFVDQVNVPIIWIDHHPPKDIRGVKYFNPLLKNKKDIRPTSYWCYKLTKENLWIAMVGIIGDWSTACLKEFSKKYPDLINNENKNERIIYSTPFGRLVRTFAFILKGKTSQISKLISVLAKIESPYELLKNETSKAKYITKYVENIEKKYNLLLEKALSTKQKGKLLIFIYPSKEFSFTAELSNELLAKSKKEIFIIGRKKENEISFSIRSKADSKYILPPIIEKSLQGIRGYGGGHPHACGTNIAVEDYEKFIENFKKNLAKS